MKRPHKPKTKIHPYSLCTGEQKTWKDDWIWDEIEGWINYGFEPSPHRKPEIQGQVTLDTISRLTREDSFCADCGIRIPSLISKLVDYIFQPSPFIEYLKKVAPSS